MLLEHITNDGIRSGEAGDFGRFVASDSIRRYVETPYESGRAQSTPPPNT
jgi:hypothetical protein